MSAVRRWLEDLGFGRYADAFEANDIEPDLIPDLTDETLEKIGVASAGHRMRLLKAAAGFAGVNGDNTESGNAADGGPGDAPVAKYVPAAIARKIRGAGAALAGERKQVTILFADVKGSFSLIQGLDPEEARALLDPLVALMMDAVHAYEGTVNDVQGDGIMAIFGAPIAHEDHALRACRAALAMIDQVRRRMHRADGDDPGRPEVQLRVGLHSGEVVVRAINNDLTMSYSAIGETTHLAARMEQLAAPGTIQMTGDTLRLVQGLVAVAACGETAVKGLAEPVAAYRLNGLSGARSRLEAAAREGLTPFVGRQRELAALDIRLTDTEKGHGRVVMISGDPGAGKSRLLHEFRHRIAGRAHWSEGHCISFGQAMAFHPLIDLARRNFRIEDDDSPADARAKITAGLKRVSAALAEKAGYMHHLLGVAAADDPVQNIDPQVRRSEILDLMLRTLILASALKPQILVYEDLHWSDTASTEVLGHLVDHIPASRVMMIATIRTGYPTPFAERSFVSRLALANLKSADCDRIVQAVLAAEALPAGLQALIRRKAEGNPFFVEELVKSLKESGSIRRDGERWVLTRPLDQTEVPDTVHGVLMSRIDRLDDAPRHTLQLASVIGREFTQRLLDRIADLGNDLTGNLRALQAIELIHQKALYPELAFMFKHALAQDVAYGSLLVAHRRRLHRQVAAAITELYRDRLDDHHAVIAHHYAAAEDWAEAACGFEKAAQHAIRCSAMQEAITLARAALDALAKASAADGGQDSPARRYALHGKLAECYGLISRFGEAHQHHREAARIAAEAGDQANEGWATAAMAMVSLFAHRFDQANGEAVQAVDLGQAVADEGIIAAGNCAEAWVQLVTGDLETAVIKFETSDRLATPAAAHYAALAGAGLTFSANWRGAYDQAISQGERTVAAARRSNGTVPLLLALMALGLSHAGKGAYHRALATLGEGLDLAGKLGDEIFRNRLLNSRGWVHAECGDLAGAIALNEQALDFSTERGDPETIANARLNLADCFLARGDAALACEWFESVYKLVGNPATSDWMKWRYSQHLFAGFGEACLARDRVDKAADWADQCLALADRTRSTKYLIRGHRLKAAIARARRDWDAAEAALAQALAFAAHIDNPAQAWRTQLAHARLCADTDRHDQAARATEAARRLLHRLRAGLQDPALAESLDQAITRRLTDQTPA